jgi:hypothetical protein
MASFKEYERYDALGLAALIRSKAVSPAEVLQRDMFIIVGCNAAHALAMRG